MRKFLLALSASLCLALPALAQESAAPAPSETTIAAPALTGLAAVIAGNAEAIARPSRQTIGPVVAAIVAAGEGAPGFLAAWADKRLGQRKSDGAIFVVEKQGAGYALRASNPSLYHVSISNLDLQTTQSKHYHNLSGGMVAPGGFFDFPVAQLSGNAQARELTFYWLNDYGAREVGQFVFR